MAGTERESFSAFLKAEGEVGIGLHRPYFSAGAYADSPARVAELQQGVTSAVRGYLRREQVPERFIERMLETSSREIYWLREIDEPWILNGRAAWFEEMMIARCAFDPAYERAIDQLRMRLYEQNQRPADNVEYQTYLKSRVSYNACEYQARRQAQARIQQAK